MFNTQNNQAQDAIHTDGFKTMFGSMVNSIDPANNLFNGIFKPTATAEQTKDTQVDEKFSGVFEKIADDLGKENAIVFIKAVDRFTKDIEEIDKRFADLALVILQSLLDNKQNVQETTPTETKQTQAVKPGKKSEKEAATV